MPPPYKVTWSDEALENVDSIVAYLEAKWSHQEADSFIETLEKQEIIFSYHLKNIEQVPHLFGRTPNNEILRNSEFLVQYSAVPKYFQFSYFMIISLTMPL